MSINHDALLSIENRQRRAFYAYEELADRYVPGETFLLDDALNEEDIFCMVIGEAPGATEHTKLRPFVGRAGILLRQLLDSVSLPPAWITNVVKFRPMGNRTPTDAEIESAKPYLRAEWEAIGRPRTVVCLGNTALMAVTGKRSVLQRAGKLEQYKANDGGPIWLWPMYHPSFVLRGDTMVKARAEAHWRALSDWLDKTYA